MSNPKHPQDIVIEWNPPSENGLKFDMEEFQCKIDEEREARLVAAREAAKDRDEVIDRNCVVCDSPIIARLRKPTRHFDMCTPIGGPSSWGLPSPAHPVGYHCSKCHIEYNSSIVGESTGATIAVGTSDDEG